MNNNILLDSSTPRYETHMFSRRKLPFIFHKDTIAKYSIHNVHENMEFLYITEGQGYICCDDSQLQLRTGDLVTINSNVVHQVVSQQGIVYYCLIVDMGFLAENDLPGIGLQLTPLIQDEKAKCLFEVVTHAWQAGGEWKNAAMRAAVLNFLLYLCQNHRAKTLQTGQGRNAAVQKAVGYIKANLSSKLTADAVAAAAGVSKYHFLRQFKKYTGYTLCTYVNLLRCEQAQQLLRKGASSKQAAIACGFDNFSYFAKVFEKYTGVLPSQYAEREP